MRDLIETIIRRSVLAGATAAALWPASAAALTCTVSAGSMPFGSYNAVAQSQVSAIDTVSIVCAGPGALTYNVTFSPGQSGNAIARYMLSGTDRLAYQIYRDSAHTQVLGDGTGGTVSYAGSAPTSPATTQVSLAVYGAIPARQPAVPGAYTDTLLVIVSY